MEETISWEVSPNKDDWDNDPKEVDVYFNDLLIGKAVRQYKESDKSDKEDFKFTFKINLLDKYKKK